MYEEFNFDKLPFGKIEKSYDSYERQYDKMASTLAKRGETPYIPKYTYDEYFDQWVISHDADAKVLGNSKNFPRELASKQMYNTSAAQANALAKGLIEAGLSDQSVYQLKRDIRSGKFNLNGKSVWTEIKDKRQEWLEEAIRAGKNSQEANLYASIMVSRYFFGSPD